MGVVGAEPVGSVGNHSHTSVLADPHAFAMGTSEATGMEDRAANLKAARRQRARRLRRRVVGGAVALFVATWLLITVTLASGHDPALST